jgi:hypothetical protein
MRFFIPVLALLGLLAPQTAQAHGPASSPSVIP